MSTKNEARVVVRSGVVADAETQGFQSREALTKATAQPPEENEEPKSAVVQEDEPAPVRVPMVEVRLRENLQNMRYGKTTYNFLKGKPCLVPVHIKRHLEEKGYL